MKDINNELTKEEYKSIHEDIATLTEAVVLATTKMGQQSSISVNVQPVREEQKKRDLEYVGKWMSQLKIPIATATARLPEGAEEAMRNLVEAEKHKPRPLLDWNKAKDAVCLWIIIILLSSLFVSMPFLYNTKLMLAYRSYWACAELRKDNPGAAFQWVMDYHDAAPKKVKGEVKQQEADVRELRKNIRKCQKKLNPLVASAFPDGVKVYYVRISLPDDGPHRGLIWAREVKSGSKVLFYINSQAKIFYTNNTEYRNFSDITNHDLESGSWRQL